MYFALPAVARTSPARLAHLIPWPAQSRLRGRHYRRGFPLPLCDVPYLAWMLRLECRVHRIAQPAQEWPMLLCCPHSMSQTPIPIWSPKSKAKANAGQVNQEGCLGHDTETQGTTHTYMHTDTHRHTQTQTPYKGKKKRKKKKERRRRDSGRHRHTHHGTRTHPFPMPMELPPFQCCLVTRPSSQPVSQSLHNCRLASHLLIYPPPRRGARRRRRKGPFLNSSHELP
ncbi:hypothetical protein B0I35DRAFT_418589 [Stachybotrys elegans]|uniref:Uncharacterized protein n=1 Tax=Stachybotrys elegans TaxID=80388 RepID=A0A8K0T808_9HYPO|nr:hypothetical protein B0I35DRAFT_418589 [Stachybotrys elegans]